MERPRKRETPVGPEGEIYLGNSDVPSSETEMSPQEQLAHLVSKPIIEDDYDKGGENNKEQENSKQGGEPGDVEKHHEEEPERKSPREEQERHDEEQEEAQRRSPAHKFHHFRHFRHPFKRSGAFDYKAANERNLFEEIRNYIKRGKITKPALVKRSRKAHKSKTFKMRRNKIVKSVISNRKNATNAHKDISARHQTKNITTRNLFPFSDFNVIPGSTSENFGTQFSEPYRGGKDNGNNGYSKGEYFGNDMADTQDNEAGLRLGGQNIGTSKSLVENPEEKHGVLLESEKLEGFEKHTKTDAHPHTEGK